MLLDGKVAIITGAASGIGQATAVLFAENGAKVAVVDINLKGAQETADLITRQGGDAIAIFCDVTDEESNKQMYAKAMEKYGRLDILHSNAGIANVFDEIENISIEAFEKVHAINVKGPFLNAKHAAPIMKKQGGGAILFTSSIAGTRPIPRLAAYGSSKGAVQALAKGLALEFASYKIRVNVICPTATDTPLLRNQVGEEMMKKMAKGIPLGRLGRVDDMASAALFLCSDNASFITGVIMEMGGGRAY